MDADTTWVASPGFFLPTVCPRQPLRRGGRRLGSRVSTVATSPPSVRPSRAAGPDLHGVSSSWKDRQPRGLPRERLRSDPTVRGLSGRRQQSTERGWGPRIPASRSLAERTGNAGVQEGGPATSPLPGQMPSSAHSARPPWVSPPRGKPQMHGASHWASPHCPRAPQGAGARGSALGERQRPGPPPRLSSNFRNFDPRAPRGPVSISQLPLGGTEAPVTPPWRTATRGPPVSSLQTGWPRGRAQGEQGPRHPAWSS